MLQNFATGLSVSPIEQARFWVKGAHLDTVRSCTHFATQRSHCSASTRIGFGRCFPERTYRRTYLFAIGEFGMKKQMVCLGLALIAMLSIIFLTPAVEGLPHQGKVALGVGIFAIIVWITQALDDAQSGLFIVVALVVFKAATIRQALSGYSTTGVWIVVYGMVMATAMSESGLSRRMALRMVTFAGKKASNLYWMFSLISFVMTFFIPSLAAKTLLLIPILSQMSEAMGSQKGKSSMTKGLLFIITITACIFCVASMTSHAAFPITVSLIANATGTTIGWFEWFRVGAVPGTLCGFLSVVVIKWLWPPESNDISAGQVVVRNEIAKLGPMTGKEIYTLIVFLLTLGLWATDKLHGFDATLVTMACVLALIFPGSQQIMSWKMAQAKVPWNILIVYGAGLSLGAALAQTGAASWIAKTFFSPLAVFSLKTQMVAFIWIMLGLQVFFTGAGPKTTALTPVVIAYASANGLDVAPFAMLVSMNMIHQYLLPVTNLSNIIGLATEEVTAGELMKTGAVLSLYAAAFMTLMVYTYWSWIGIV